MAVEHKTYQEIVRENIKLHHIEARHYERLHPEEFNWFEQGRIWADIKFLHTQVPGGGRVLDIGCGTGNLFLKLLALGHEVWGVDVSQDMVTVLQEKIPPGSRNRTKLLCQNVDDFISSCSEKFDLIVMSSVLHHLPDYLESLARIAGLLAPGGLLYITHEPTQYALSKDRFLRKILWQADNVVYQLVKAGRIPNVGPRSYRMSDYHLYHGFQEDKVLHACAAAGLEVIKFLRYSSAMRLGASCWFDSRVLKSKGQFCLIAGKNDVARTRETGAAAAEFDVRKMAAYYDRDSCIGGAFQDILSSQYGIKDGQIINPTRHYFFYEKLLPYVAQTISEGSTVIDIGCGTGVLSCVLGERTDRYVGMDISIENLKKARQRNPSSKCAWVVADAQNPPFKNGCFDAAVSLEVIEHVPDTHAYLSAAGRIVKPEGVVLFSTPGNIFFTDNVRFMYQQQHLYGFNPRKIRSLMRENLFAVESLRGFGFRLHFLIPLWLGSDVIKYIYTKTNRRQLKAGYGLPISFEFDVVASGLFTTIHSFSRAVWKFLVMTLGGIGKTLPGFSSTMVVICRK